MSEEIIDPERADSYPPVIQSILKAPSPASAHLGLSLVSIDREALSCRIAFDATERLCNKWGGLQGGMVAAMLDDAMSIAVALGLDWGQITPTLEMKVSYLSPARPGRLYAEGRVLKRGSSIAFTEARLADERGEVLATASGTGRIVQMRRDI